MLPVERTRTDENEMYGAVSNALWMQRELLETLLYRLVGEQLILTSGTTRWLAKADADLRHAVDELRRGEVARAMHVESLAARLGLDGDPALSELIALAPDTWSDILADHHRALKELAFEAQRVADQNGRLLQAGAVAVRETLAGIGQAVHRYDATGSAVRGNPRAMLLDEQV